MGRFLNADGYADTGDGIFGTNMFAYCGNNPVTRSDPTGQIFGIDDAVFWISAATVLAIGALWTATMTETKDFTLPSAPSISWPKDDLKPKVDNKEKELAPAIPKDHNEKKGTTYYHATTRENALAIMSSNVLLGSQYEAGYVFAWRKMPTAYALKNSGARSDATIISFKTNVSFVRDGGIRDEKVLQCQPVVSSRPGPIAIWDVQIVRN